MNACRLIFLSVSFFFWSPQICAESALPDLGGQSHVILSDSDDEQLGREFFRSIRHSMKIITEPQIQFYISSLGQRLVSVSDNPDQTFHFFVVDNPSVNAFAGPGGYIGVFAGFS